MEGIGEGGRKLRGKVKERGQRGKKLRGKRKMEGEMEGNGAKREGN